MNVMSFLERHRAPYECMPRRRHVAPAVGGEVVVETHLLRTPDGFLIALAPAGFEVDLEAIACTLGLAEVRPVSTTEMAEMFPHHAPRQAPAFGSAFGMRTIVDLHLACYEHLILVGDRPETRLRMTFQDYERLEAPINAYIARPAAIGANSGKEALS